MTKAPDQIASRETSIKRGMDFIYRVAGTTDGFDRYGTLLICCFALVGATSRDASLRQLARSRAQNLAQRWGRAHPFVPAEAGPDLVLDFVLVSYALSRIGLRDVALNAQIRTAARRFSAQDTLGFNPVSEPPANDLSYRCNCGLENQRGRTYCKKCRRRLETQSRYRVWMRALASTYVSGRCGILFGARYADVLKWLPVMRPYPAGTDEDEEVVRDAIFAVTHIVYTFNDYNTYRLSPRWLPQELAYLKANVEAACVNHDPELLGELLDSLRAFGLPAGHPLIDRGTSYLLANQNEDGSWGDPDEENIRTRCHTTWTAIDGLRTYAWRGERLSRPKVESILKQRGHRIMPARSRRSL
jgi:RNase P subunit RPR2